VALEVFGRYPESGVLAALRAGWRGDGDPGSAVQVDAAYTRQQSA
jgi:hypothetical protein